MRMKQTVVFLTLR